MTPSDEDDELEARFPESDEELVREWMKEDAYNAKVLATWAKAVTVMGDPRRADYVLRLEAALAYMMRRLSKGFIPKIELVHSVLSGSADIPLCGYLGCAMTGEHVH